MADVQTEAVATCIQAGVNMLLIGEPGTTKTSKIKAIGQSLGRHVEVVTGSDKDPTEFTGLPVVVKDEVLRVPPRWAKRLYEATQRGQKGVLVLDELTTCAPSVQAVMLRVARELEIGDLTLDRSMVSVIAIANPPDHAAGGWDLAAPLANRFLHYQWRLDVAEWADAVLAGFPTVEVEQLPDNWTEHLPQARNLVAGFARVKSTLIQAMPRDEGQQSGAWPSARTWYDLVVPVLAANMSLGRGLRHDLTVRLVQGAVGTGAAMEFLNWAVELDLPDPETVLANPQALRLPSRGDRAYAVLGSLVAAVLARNTPQRWLAAWEALSQVPDGMVDIAATSARALAQNRPSPCPPAPKAALRFARMLQLAGLLQVA